MKPEEERMLERDELRLRNLHIGAGVLHLVQTAYGFAVSNTVYKDKGTFQVDFRGKKYFEYKLADFISLAPLLSSLNHFYSAAAYKGHYRRIIRNQVNDLRWWEYALSAGIMTVSVAQLSGIRDWNTLVALLGVNAGMQFTGHSSEVNRRNGASVQGDLGVGFILFTITWLILVPSFYDALEEFDREQAEDNELTGEPVQEIPPVVYSIIFLMLTLFATFGAVQFAFARSVRKVDAKGNPTYGDLKKYINTEYAFVILSFVSKTLLHNLTLFGAVSRLDDKEEE